ncbi:dihydrodipicolinate synthase family protein [Amycolatopsis sp. H20-H5]|uniref:dihydrodipicolinate synthase family protein n=1 Tax=Amycolatopsis sp. H20-H5 TaxID=3046309 RepID=UPI002DB61222|nr:dihydrodipicolinate synthase family protein [Amycolatopsis sp. H20-H5]MEC3977551.1 dihydrodipicolinate synthase family protein [Amycolatopsis sp. H20-H5]
MTATVTLPGADGRLSELTLTPPPPIRPRPAGPITSRVAFAAAHVVPAVHADNVPGAPAEIDWDSTLGFRRHLWSHGLGVAEAMDTAQRGMGLDWRCTRELIRRSAAEARTAGGRIAAGAGTDQLGDGVGSLAEITAAYEEQTEVVEDSGAQVILMASRQLARLAKSPEDYREVYDRLLDQVAEPVVLHWLGPMFDPALTGYWGSPEVDVAAETVLCLIRDHAAKVDGIKVSLLDAEREKRLRAALPAGVRLYTGDDFNYPELIRGDGEHHSDALLGIFAAIAPAASTALRALDAGDLDGYDAAFAPTVPLARHIFAAPTYYYKTGIAFLSWLGGHQPGFTMVGGLQNARSAVHLAGIVRLADSAGLLPDVDLAAHRVRLFLETAGVPR